MHLNSLGHAAMGFAVVSIDGATPAALSGIDAGNPSGPYWLSTTKIAYQNFNATNCLVQSYDTGTTALATLDSQGANIVAAGGGIWAAWLADPTVGVRTNIPGVGPFPAGAIGDVSPDGEFCLVNTYPEVTGLTVYSAAGATLVSLPTVVLKQNFVRLKSHLLLYRDASGWVMNHVLGGSFAFRPRINEPIFWIVPVTTAAGKTFVVEVSERITLRYADRAEGYQLMPDGTTTFNPDVIEYSAGVLRIGWSSSSGELPEHLTLMDVTIATGATQIGTVVGGSISWAAGSTLELTTFEVGPLQGSNTGGALYPPLKEPVVDKSGLMTRPWAMYEQNVRTGLGGAIAAIDALPPVVPAPPGFGIVANGVESPIVATMPTDTVTVTSSDGSVQLVANALTKTLDLRVSPIGGLAQGVPGLPGEDADVFVIPGPAGASGSGGGTAYIPVTTGAEPVVLVSDGAGQLVLTAYTP